MNIGHERGFMRSNRYIHVNIVGPPHCAVIILPSPRHNTRTINGPDLSLNKNGSLHVMQSHPLSKTHFIQYVAGFIM